MKKELTPTNAMRLLQQAEIAGTPQRLAILNILQKATQPLSVNAIREKLKTTNSVNKVTVYRIISLFKKQGIVRDVLSTDGTVYLEMATSDHPVHPHFSCRNCGTMNCLTPLTFSQARELLASPDHYSVDHIEINISGLCNSCRHATKLQRQSGKRGHDDVQK
jgi:Fur family transcriptional regulator, ferric uptake regulator